MPTTKRFDSTMSSTSPSSLNSPSKSVGSDPVDVKNSTQKSQAI